MFGGARRRGQPNPPLTSATVNPNAATAAASAFMSAAKQNSDKSLSSAAAAAALRARPQTPTDVGGVQTKRTMRRSASVSSSGSAPAGAGAGDLTRRTSRLERRGSSSSMAVRTFRTPSPSPHRAPPAPRANDQPPVPRVPEGHKKSASPGSVAAGMQMFRTASQRKSSGLPSWYTQPQGDPSSVRTSDAAMTKATPQRADSRASSINYSYPTVYRPQSPPASPTAVHTPTLSTAPPPRTPASPPRSSKASITSSTGGRPEPQMVYDPNSRRMVPAPVEEAEYHIRGGTDKEGKRKSTGVQRAGSHLAKGTVARPKGTFLDYREREHSGPREERRVIDTAPFKEQSHILQGEPTAPGRLERREERPVEIDRQSRSPEPETSRPKSPPSQTLQTAREQTVSHEPGEMAGSRPPATVEEDKEDQDGLPTTTRLPQKVLSAPDSVPTRQTVFDQPRALPTAIPEESDPVPEEQPEPMQTLADDGQTLTERRKESVGPVDRKPVLGFAREGSSSLDRSNSPSPVRQARFASSPSASLTVRHDPLPRSASPIKPALKQTGSRRDLSPSDAGSDNAAYREASPNSREEPSISRKKSVRVSFDDRSTKVMGESAQSEDLDLSDTPSPLQAKRPWYGNIGRSKRREFALDDDEIMKPRPALPSFGSIREKKARQSEERPLVRPYEPANSPEPSSPTIRPRSSSTPPGTSDSQASSLAQSGDHAIGAVFAQEQASRNPANISRFREPLPPVVTSVEAPEYMSDTTLDSDQENSGSGVAGGDTEAVPRTQTTQNTGSETREGVRNGTAIVEDKVLVQPEEMTKVPSPSRGVPEISIIQPSTRMRAESSAAEEPGSPQRQYFDVPGGFPMEDESGESPKSNNEIHTNTNVPSPPGDIFEPTAEVQAAQTESLPQTTLVTAPQVPTVAESEDETDGSSIYSDAYEDLSEADGPGFLSLDAVVDSPNPKAASPARDIPASLVRAMVTEGEKSYTTQTPTSLQYPPPPGDVNEWELAKAYWRSLTAEKRQQLEREALEEAGADGDREEVPPPIQRNSSRRKLDDPKQTAAKPKSPAAPDSKPAKPINADRVSMIQPDSKADHAPVSSVAAPRMRSSLREREPDKGKQPQAPNALRKSMRSSADDLLNGRASSRPVTSKHERPVSMQTNATSLNAAGTALSNQGNLTLRRRGSDGSDSSFKRARPKTSEGIGFRKTLRQSEAAQTSSRFSLRSLSPNGSPRRASSIMSAGSAPPVSTMRRSLRSGSESNQERKGSTHFPSFGRSSKATGRRKSKTSDRLGDSSDEGVVGSRRFRSRFDDSSEEEDLGPLPSGRGGVLAKGTLRGSTQAPASFGRTATVPEETEESPELPDSDDDMPTASQIQQRRAAARGALGDSNSGSPRPTTLTRSRSGHGGLDPATSSTVASPKERRGSLMGILRRNKKGDHRAKIQRSEPGESAARRDTKLERSTSQLRDLRDDGRSTSPKLQKRSATLKRGESWPLPEEDGQGPNSASGPATQQRLTVTARRSTSFGVAGVQDNNNNNNDDIDGRDDVVAANGHKKKKKFGVLRRMLHLDD
ncbi:hypothetical protein DL764_005600 [Monosporascus ibericus]|uniref:Uncharacterized protein n=1 Tax=Monosporascus ibericus TaxID=155417 RepID=A0A4Q4TB75_9PEZI|nr:hypothetical protein DL764_005600 [Monosporascus ibericus]